VAETDTDSGGGPTRIEYGGLPAANQARNDFEDHLCSQDDRRQKVVVLAPDAPAGVIDQAEAAATTSRAEADTPALEAVELTESEKRGLDFTRDGVNVAKARYLKGLGQEYDVDAFQHVDPAEIDAVTDARPILERAQQTGGTGRGGGAQYDDEGEERRERERQQQAEKHAKAGCDHARDECEHGDPAACEYLTEACGYDSDEIGGLIGERVEDETDQQELVTVGGGEYPEMEVSPAAAGALRQAWQGYKGAVSDLDDALDAVRSNVKNARRSMSAINAIRGDHGQDDLHPDRLHEILAALEAMPGDIPEVRTLAHYGVFDSADGPTVEKFGTDHEAAVQRFQDRLEAEGWDAEAAAEKALQMAEERQRDDPRSLRERAAEDFISHGVNRELNRIGSQESARQSRKLDRVLAEEDGETVRADLAEQGSRDVSVPSPWRPVESDPDAEKPDSYLAEHPDGYLLEVWRRSDDLDHGAGQFDVEYVDPRGTRRDGSGEFHDTAQDAVDAVTDYITEVRADRRESARQAEEMETVEWPQSIGRFTLRAETASETNAEYTTRYLRGFTSLGKQWSDEAHTIRFHDDTSAYHFNGEQYDRKMSAIDAASRHLQQRTETLNEQEQETADDLPERAAVPDRLRDAPTPGKFDTDHATAFDRSEQRIEAGGRLFGPEVRGRIKHHATHDRMPELLSVIGLPDMLSRQLRETEDWETGRDVVEGRSANAEDWTDLNGVGAARAERLAAASTVIREGLAEQAVEERDRGDSVPFEQFGGGDSVGVTVDLKTGDTFGINGTVERHRGDQIDVRATDGTTYLVNVGSEPATVTRSSPDRPNELLGTLRDLGTDRVPSGRRATKYGGTHDTGAARFEQRRKAGHGPYHSHEREQLRHHIRTPRMVRLLRTAGFPESTAKDLLRQEDWTTPAALLADGGPSPEDWTHIEGVGPARAERLAGLVPLIEEEQARRAAPGKFDTDHAGAANRLDQRRPTDYAPGDDSTQQFAKEQQGTLGVGVESEETAEEKQVTLTGGDADDPDEQALPTTWTKNRPGGNAYTAGPLEIRWSTSDGRGTVTVSNGETTETVADGLPDEQTAETVARNLTTELPPRAVSFSKDDATVPDAAARAKSDVLNDEGGLFEYGSSGPRKVTLHDDDGGVTLNVPEQVDGWRYDGDAPPTRGALVWVDPDDPDHYVAVQKTGSAQWLASHVPADGDRTNDSARYATDALDYAEELMNRFEAGGSGNS
jgi:hypothetical protein